MNTEVSIRVKVSHVEVGARNMLLLLRLLLSLYLLLGVKPRFTAATWSADATRFSEAVVAGNG